MSGDYLRDKVKSIKVSKDQEELLLSGTRSKSGSFVSEGSDIDTSHVTGTDTPPLHHNTSSSETAGLTNETEERSTDIEVNQEQFDGGSFSESLGSNSKRDEESSSVSNETSSDSEWIPHQHSEGDQCFGKTPSVVTLKSASSSCSSHVSRGGSPNWIHHWKQNITTTSFYQKLHKMLSPQVLFRSCSAAVIINILILIL